MVVPPTTVWTAALSKSSALVCGVVAGTESIVVATTTASTFPSAASFETLSTTALALLISLAADNTTSHCMRTSLLLIAD